MTPEAGRFLAKARQCLADATVNRVLVPRIAGREAYLAAYHAAEALIYERIGRIAKTHRGVRTEFARIARDEPRIERVYVEFLGQAYELKSLADYGTGPEAEITSSTATSAIDVAARFVECIGGLLGDQPQV